MKKVYFLCKSPVVFYENYDDDDKYKIYSISLSLTLSFSILCMCKGRIYVHVILHSPLENWGISIYRKASKYEGEEGKFLKMQIDIDIRVMDLCKLLRENHTAFCLNFSIYIKIQIAKCCSLQHHCLFT